MFLRSKPLRIVAVLVVLVLVALPFALGADVTQKPPAEPVIVRRTEQLPILPTAEELAQELQDLSSFSLLTTAYAAMQAEPPAKTPESKPESTPPQSTAESKPESKPESVPESKPESEPESEPESIPEAEDPPDELPVTGSSGNGMQNSLQTSDGMIRVKDLERVAANEDFTSKQVPAAFLDDVSGRGEISVSTFKSLAKKHALSQSYMQRFIDDAFVYKVGSDYKYVPVDFSLKLHNYNWDNLEHYTYEKDYLVSGNSRAHKAIDISVHQGNINWNRVKADGVEIVYIRLGYRGYTEGAIKIDDNYYKNVEGALDAGLRIGVYFYSQATTKAEAVEEAEFVLQHIQDYDLHMPVMFDIEGGENSKWRTYGMSIQAATNVVKAFCNRIESAGHDVILYSYAKYFSENLDLAQLQQYDFWLAQYYRVPFFPYHFEAWQYSASGRVDGISGPVDMNLWFLD